MEMRRSGFVRAVLKFTDRDMIIHIQLDDEESGTVRETG